MTPSPTKPDMRDTVDMSDTEFLPCPFCGGAGEHQTDTEDEEYGEEWIGCTSCGATTAIEVWNRRVPDQSSAVRIEALEQQWQPIETAPRDGTRIILSWGGVSCVGYYLDNSRSKAPWQGWEVPSMELWPSGQPTHWMPFPADLAKDKP